MSVRPEAEWAGRLRVRKGLGSRRGGEWAGRGYEAVAEHVVGPMWGPLRLPGDHGPHQLARCVTPGGSGWAVCEAGRRGDGQKALLGKQGGRIQATVGTDQVGWPKRAGCLQGLTAPASRPHFLLHAPRFRHKPRSPGPEVGWDLVPCSCCAPPSARLRVLTSWAWSNNVTWPPTAPAAVPRGARAHPQRDVQASEQLCTRAACTSL